ncbi:26S proteasome non-ATPase regulatory subunit 9 [Scaptodrosophila lebanonensis]|uniref:26S proteasome non-ATPase regulatory subunit 9 n=1 Tax=Drosophila lebanonensis TaxID=7225 RepID=A0A6J2TLH4_DROLE|nr:26S proteasome non-ATPase regulatory subunit 9 [Scaptodrosophila lebanonensis]
MASGPTTKERLERLMAAKGQLEAQISKSGQILAQNDNVGMNGSLVDAEGYPRNDIDIYQVRQARQTIICLQNDHKELMNQIQELLNQYHAEIASTDPELVNRASALELDRPTGGAVNQLEVQDSRTIVVVNLVSPNSPAEEAGIRVGDQILHFGSVNGGNFKNNLTQIGDVVRNMQNQNVQLKVKRGDKLLDLLLVPKTWSGRGLLGCNIVLPPEPMEH